MTPTQTPFQEGLEAAQTGDFARAEAIARAMLDGNPNDIGALQIIGFTAFRQGRNTAALKAFLQAVRLEPGQPRLLYWLGVLFKERGDFVQAERAFSNAVRIDPRYGEAWCHLGETFFLLDRKDRAREAIESAIRSEPQSATVLARAARLFELVHDADRARDLAARAALLDPSDEIAGIALVEMALREKRYDAVISGGTASFNSGTNVNRRNQARLRHLTATAQDRLGDYTAAFANYSEANRLQGSLDNDAASSVPSPLHTDNLDRIAAYLHNVQPADWKAPDSLEGPAPVFLLGFVRSGTTWLEQILSSHPSVTAMEEEDLFVDVWRDLLITDAGLSRLPALSLEDINRRRAQYWARADKVLAKDSRREVIVDKLPLNTVNLLLIWRLFPEAKIIFALRDPRDAVFSAFQQHFQVNAGMAHFLDIRTGAAFYDRIMTIGALMREKAPLVVHEVRYERVVADLPAEIARLLDFLGLPWNDNVLNYQETARSRTIRTPSARQVIEKPYATSIGKWRHYRDGMAPVLPILAPWVAKFGYDPD